MTAIYRYEIPVDDEWHVLPTWGAVLHVACHVADVVEVWAYSPDPESPPVTDRRMRVFGTGQRLPAVPMDHVGTAIGPSGLLVWHLFENRQP